MGINDILGFDFLDMPESESLEHALKQLYLLDAIDKNGRLRALGYELSKFPLEPSYAKCLLAARLISKSIAADCAKIFSLLSTESIWMGVSKLDEKRQMSVQRTKEKYSNSFSDHLILLNIFETWVNIQQKSDKHA